MRPERFPSTGAGRPRLFTLTGFILLVLFPFHFRHLRRLLQALLILLMVACVGSHLLQKVDLIRRKLGQPPDEGDKPPDGFGTVLAAPGRHPGEADAVGDDVEQFPVGQLLRIRVSHVGGLRVKVAPEGGVPTPGHPVAQRTVFDKMLAGLFQVLFR